MAKYCNQPGCNTLIEKGRYCNEHKRYRKKKKYYRSRNKSFYRSKAWEDLRQYVQLRDGYRCANCGRIVFGREGHVDHILPIWLRPDLRLDPENCRYVCSKCHYKVEYRPKNEHEENKKKNFKPEDYF